MTRVIRMLRKNGGSFGSSGSSPKIPAGKKIFNVYRSESGASGLFPEHPYNPWT
jgi:hypothetical protein